MRIVDWLNENTLEDRPNLSSRTEFDHWEGHTVELVHDQNYLVTFIERKTQFLATKFVPNKKSETIRNAILSALDPFHQAVKSIILDNGTHSLTIKPLKLLERNGVFANQHCLGNVTARSETSALESQKMATTLAETTAARFYEKRA